MKNSINFIVFFLLVIGNGKFIVDNYGNKVEYIGLVLLLICSIYNAHFTKTNIKRSFKIIFCSLIMTLGAFYNNVSNNAKLMIFFSSFLLMNYAEYSKKFINENIKIKYIGDALLIGMIVNSLIGIMTGTLGLSFDSNEAIIKVLFLCGYKIKNYCGGIWLTIYILYYVYYLREKSLPKHKLRFILLSLLILLCGSKGAFLLLIIFIIYINKKNIIKFKEKQNYFFNICILIIFVFLSIYVYKNFLILIPTYAYRMRGLNKIFSITTKDYTKFIFGISKIAYANNGLDYTTNMRNFLGWNSSVEMAYLNIMIKNGFLGILVYLYIFKEIISKTKFISKDDRNLVFGILIVMLMSGFTETYIASIHYVVGPVLFCLINSLIIKKSPLKESNY